MLKTHQIKEEPVDVDEKSGVIIDSTMEYCRNLGTISSFVSLTIDNMKNNGSMLKFF